MVNPDGKVGLKVRAGAHHPERTAPARDRAARPFRPRPTLPADRPSSPVPRPHPPQITRRLIAKLDGEEPASRPAPEPAQTSTSAPTAPVGPPAGFPIRALVSPSRAATRDAAAVADYRPMFPGLDDALARSLRVGELLLKNEQAELEKVREYASQAQATTHAFRRGETPCGEEREACRKCYEENAADTLRCGAEVAAYDACARAASEAFVGKGFPAKAAANAEAAA